MARVDPEITVETLTLHVDGAEERVLAVVAGCTSPYTGRVLSASGDNESVVVGNVLAQVEQDRDCWEWLADAAERQLCSSGGKR